MVEKIYEQFKDYNEVKIKVYNVEYTIEKQYGDFIIYQSQNKLRSQHYDTIEDLIENYIVYGENLKNNLHSIELVLDDIKE